MDTGYGVKGQAGRWLRGTVKVKEGDGGVEKHSISGPVCA
jgi:hypothetical protein